jgi:quinol monooxygenase YgiN
MITVMTTVHIKPGHEEEWEQVWQRARELYRSHDGFGGSRRLRHTDHPGHWTVETEWASREQYNTFVRNMGLRWIDDALHLWDRPPHTVYMDIVQDTDTVAGP